MIHVVKSIMYWDMCGIDALMKGRFGITSAIDKSPLIYDHTVSDFTMQKGIILARSQAIYDLCYERLESYL